MGNKCDPSLKVCTCAADADCAKSNFGHKCDLASKACKCDSAKDCPQQMTCVSKTVYGTKYCGYGPPR